MARCWRPRYGQEARSRGREAHPSEHRRLSFGDCRRPATGDFLCARFSPIRCARSMDKHDVDQVGARAETGGVIARAVAFARREPERVIAWVLGLHLVVWTLLPILLYRNLQLDLLEDLALGKEWQLGYWKHPPLPWCAADLLYRLTGDVRAVYLLGPLSAVVCLYAVWRLGCETAGRERALIAVLALEGLHFFNFSVVKFA